ncbi:MAG: hypothetical protein ACFE95_09860 [Candidatus Hodarchaeota archaeon]
MILTVEVGKIRVRQFSLEIDIFWGELRKYSSQRNVVLEPAPETKDKVQKSTSFYHF